MCQFGSLFGGLGWRLVALGSVSGTLGLIVAALGKSWVGVGSSWTLWWDLGSSGGVLGALLGEPGCPQGRASNPKTSTAGAAA